MSNMRDDIEEVLYDEGQLREKIKEMGESISKDYEGKDLILIGVLKGSVIFMSDLLKEITIPCMMDFMAVSSYGNNSTTSGVVRILKDLDYEIENKHVIIVEDIVDTGTTLRYLVDYLRRRNPASIEIAALLNKKEARMVDVDSKYTGFVVKDKFLVGYGLDYAEKYRNLPYIGILKEKIYK